MHVEAHEFVRRTHKNFIVIALALLKLAINMRSSELKNPRLHLLVVMKFSIVRNVGS